MGNSGSHQNGHIEQRIGGSLEEGHQQWPIARGRYQHKLIVPDRDAHQRLRPTGNGEILHAGGTISGRGNANNLGGGSAGGNQQQPPPPWQSGGNFRRSHSPSERHRHPYNQPRVLTPSHRKNQIKRFGSEPDLRNPSSHDYPADRYKSRKKYKAPLPPTLVAELSNVENENYNGGIETGSPIRRARLFKTRAETKKKSSSPVLNSNNRSSSTSNSIEIMSKMRPLEKHQQKFKSTNSLLFNSTGSNQPAPCNRPRKLSDGNGNKMGSVPVMQRTKSSPDFQAELKEATRLVHSKRLSVIENNSNTNEAAKEKLKTMDHNIYNKEMIKSKLSSLKAAELAQNIRRPASGKESAPEQWPPKVKTFYFGMEQRQELQVSNSISSDMTSESEAEELSHNISLQLRPILPKKQLEIPRFSPAAAWKLLSSVDTGHLLADSTLASEEDSIFNEDRIEKMSRPPPPNPTTVNNRWVHDKSGDSGISGDETPEAVPGPINVKQRGISWTPQQDLGDDSSLEDGSNLDFPNVPTRTHVFSLSLPRDNHLAGYVSEKTNLQPYSSLQKLKRSMSGVLGNLSANKKDNEIDLDANENWFLSRSAPNSLNNNNSLEYHRRQHRQDDFEGPKQTRRIMYLPFQSNNAENTPSRKQQRAKSYENLSSADSFKDQPENLQDPPPKLQETVSKWTKKPKKFTFQSTVRQIERRRLAEKLSKEAERKEQQRLRELEAMQRVEEEFQKKRAREKATIRQQLRLYNMDDAAWSSLPPNLDITDEVRAEPDGAVSSSASSPTFKKNNSNGSEKDSGSIAPVTHVLSEFKQPYREYKEFRCGSRYSFEQQQTTIHPRVICNMPKASGNSYNGNYRKDFAHGIKSGESSYSEESSSNTRNQSPMIGRSKRTHVTD